ncbi:MAG: hypothetical protein KIS66_04665 [Fimbriimonadaceae bacterium]|nr:hypothetical protein [Fimbriimonadaceae bacterium]
MRPRSLAPLSARILALVLIVGAASGLSAQNSRPNPEPVFRSVKSLTAHIDKLEGGEEEDAAVDPRERKEKPGVDYLKSLLYYLRQRAYPNDTVDWDAWRRGADHRDKMPVGQIGLRGDRRTLAPTGTWSYVGPKNLQVPYRTYYGIAPLSGRINAAAYHPTNSQIVYVAGASGGVHKTTDGGATWTPLTDTAWPLLHVSCLAIPASAPNTIYAGTGDFDGMVGYTNGLMRSTDGGANWTKISDSLFDGFAVSDIIVDPESPSTIVCSLSRGSSWWGKLVRTTNGGGNWSDVTPLEGWGLFASLDYAAKDGLNNRLYYATDSYRGRVLLSTNRGATWVNSGYVGTGSGSALTRVAGSKRDPLTAYVVDSSISSPGKVQKTTNGGLTWGDSTNDFPHGNAGMGATYNWSQSFYDVFIETSVANNQDVVYVGLIDVAVSINGGANWNSIGGPTYTGDAVIHNDQHSLTVNPSNANESLVGMDGGAYRLVYNPGGGTFTWTPLNAGLYTTQFYRAAFHPTNPDKMLGGTQDNATPVSTGDLANWLNRGGGDGGWCAINPANPAIQYCTAQGLATFLTTNEWSTSAYIGPPLSHGTDRAAFIAPIVLDPNNPNLLYAGANYLWRFDSSTLSWTPRVGGIEVATGSDVINCLAVAPGDSDRIYAGTANGVLQMTANGGTSWTPIDGGSPALPDRTITFLNVNPTNKSDLLVLLSGTGSGHVFRCANTLAATPVWSDRSGSGATGLPDVPANSLARDPADPQNTWYVGTDLGVFMTTNAGSTWTNVTAPLGLPNVQVNEVGVSAGYLFAATWGRGIWRVQLATTRTVSGNVTLQNFAGTVAGTPVRVEIRSPGSTVPLETYDTTLASGGAYGVVTSLNGTYDVTIKSSHWLRAKSANVSVSGSGATVSLSLVNGDVNGDNTVNIADFLQLRAAFGSSTGGAGWNPNADLNGSGSVNVADFVILRGSFGQSGAP